jgi:hypothetical protein
MRLPYQYLLKIVTSNIVIIPEKDSSDLIPFLKYPKANYLILKQDVHHFLQIIFSIYEMYHFLNQF